MIVIQQAIYGEVPGQTSGHDLLAASGEQDELFRRVSGLTDLADRPQGGIPNPIVCGLFAENHFLLIKAFPDANSGLRSGRLFVHALFISKSDLHRVRNISDVFQYHMSAIQKDAEMRPLEYHPQGKTGGTGTVNGKEAAATNALLKNEPFVWLGEEGYWAWMARIWPQLPVGVIQRLKIGAAFGPSHAKGESLNLLYIPNDAKPLWRRHSFRVIDNTTTETLQSAAAHWLVGNAEESAPFYTLLDDFEPKVDSIDIVNRLQTHGTVYHRLGQKPELRQLLVLAHFISRVNPDERSGVKGKSRLLSVILQALPDATAEQMKALTDQSWNGFPGAVVSVSDVLRDWLTLHLLQGKRAKERGSLLVKALEVNASNWWAKTVLAHVADRLRIRQTNDAEILWHWMMSEPALIAEHASWLPDDTENELVEKIPKLETAVAETVLHMAEQKRWLVLHACVATQFYSSAKAIDAQLRIDTDQHHTEGLEALSQCIKASALVPLAATKGDPRLHRIAGKLLAGDGKLMKGIDTSAEGWQLCWEASIEQGGDVWNGFSHPKQTLFGILDHLLAGISFSDTVMDSISKSQFSSLKEYPKRSSIWQMLSVKARSGFITSTLAELVDELSTGQLQYKDLETDLQKGFQLQSVQQQIIGGITIPPKKKMLLFGVLPGLGVQHARQLMQAHHFSPAEAEQFGQLLLKQGWIEVADELYDLRTHRKDLVPALLKCTSLLGFFKRLSLSASGLKRDAISREEWWDEFLVVSTQLFPGGPEQNGLWVSSGGDLAQLYTNGTGQEKWSLAVQILRNNGKPTIEKLIGKMRKAYSHNETLNSLQDTL